MPVADLRYSLPNPDIARPASCRGLPDMTDRYAVIGNPIQQSKSPIIHGLFARATGQDMSYERLLGPVGGFAATVDAFRAAGGRGLNITAPFKLDAFAYATETSARARQAGAVNAMKFDGERVIAENFDGVGLVRDLKVNHGLALRGARVLLLGAGGAVRGALEPLLAEGPVAVVIANRTAARAQEIASGAAALGPVEARGFDALDGQNFDLVLNGTSASLSDELPPVPASVFRAGALAYDMTYGKGLTPFLHLARSRGARVVDGVGMLVEQAAEAFQWWRGVRPDTGEAIRQITVPLA